MTDLATLTKERDAAYDLARVHPNDDTIAAFGVAERELMVEEIAKALENERNKLIGYSNVTRRTGYGLAINFLRTHFGGEP